MSPDSSAVCYQRTKTSPHLINLNEQRHRYLIIGGISEPGYVITKTLKDFRLNITEDISSLGFDSGTWRHHDQLKMELGVTPSIVDYSYNDVRKAYLEWARGGTVVYIPSLLFNAINKDSFFDVKYVNSIISNFANLLELISNMSNNEIMKIIFFTPNSENIHSNQQATVIRLLSLVLSSYSNANKNIKVILISFKTVTRHSGFMHVLPHSTVGCDSAHNMDTIQSTMFNSSIVQRRVIQITCNADTRLQSHDVSRVPVANREYVVGVNVRSNRHFTDSFLYMQGFYLTCARQNLDMLIFHNHLSNAFQKRLLQYFDKAVFVEVDKNLLRRRRDNDARYYFLYDYLVNHPEVKSIVFQDIKDGSFYLNPFRVMDGFGNNVLFAGTDKVFDVAPAFHGMTVTKFKMCGHREEVKTGGAAESHPFYNAGTFAGSRDVMLTFLQRIMQYLDKTPHRFRCNMAMNYLVIQNHFRDHSYSGYPFQTYYGADYGIPRGLAVKHKEAYPYDFLVGPFTNEGVLWH